MNDLILSYHEDGWTELTLNRSEVLNALSRGLLTALLAAVREASARPECRVLILTGAGERAFAAGADIAEMAGLQPDEVGRFVALGQEVTVALEACPQPVIAAVNGYALGGGCEIALACDLIVASNTAQFGQPEVTLGVPPGWGGTQRLPRRVGIGIARRMIYTGERVGAEEALGIGLADRVVPAGLLQQETRAFAAQLAAHSREGMAASKEALHAAGDLPLGDGLAREAELFARAFATDARRAAMERFVKR